MSSDENEPMAAKSLSDLFDEAFLCFNNLSKITEPTNSLKVQLKVKKCMKMFEEATKLVSMADMFSSNEEFEEISTEQIKYFLLPALLGTLAMKLCDRENRLNNVNVSEIYFYDFLHRIKDYGLTNITIPKLKSLEEKQVVPANITSKTNTEMIEQMVNTRQNKLQRYKEQKELEEQLKILQESMDNENIDEESKREYFCTLIKSYALQAVDEINSLAQEKEILAHMAQIDAQSGTNSAGKEAKPKPSPKLQPIIITKNAAQKAVFGAGYPSLPVMTVEEFYEKKIADGEWTAAGPGSTSAGGKSLQNMAANDSPAQEDPEDLKKEEDVEKDDEEYLARTRAMDEYKDNHRRGWGNRYNRS